MTITLNLQDIGNALLYVLGIGALALLAVALVRAVRILSHVDQVLAPNRAALAAALKDVPGIVDNAKAISADTREVTQAVRGGALALQRAATSVGDTVSSTAEAVRDQVEGIMALVQLIAQVIAAIRGKNRT